MQLLLALFIIYNGAMNIIKTLHSKKLSKYAQFIAEKYNKIINPKAKGKEEQREKKFKEIIFGAEKGDKKKRKKDAKIG